MALDILFKKAYTPEQSGGNPMARLESEKTTGIITPVEQVARLIRSFNRQQKARLIQLVPELYTIRPQETGVPAGQEELLEYFEHKVDVLPKRKPCKTMIPSWAG
jgi:hypothetical protein